MHKAIDEAALDAIRALEQPGTDSLLNRIIKLFLDESADLQDQIGAAVAQANADALRKSAHSLKSSSANVGALQVSEISRDLEVAGRNGDLSRTESLYDALRDALGQADAELRRILGSS